MVPGAVVVVRAGAAGVMAAGPAGVGAFIDINFEGEARAARAAEGRKSLRRKRRGLEGDAGHQHSESLCSGRAVRRYEKRPVFLPPPTC